MTWSPLKRAHMGPRNAAVQALAKSDPRVKALLEDEEANTGFFMLYLLVTGLSDKSHGGAAQVKPAEKQQVAKR